MSTAGKFNKAYGTKPIERAFGDTPDKVTRNYKRKRLRDLVADVGRFRCNRALATLTGLQH